MVVHGPGEERRLRWEAAATWPLMGAAVLFLGSYAWPILDPHLSRARVDACRIVGLAVWAVFAVDFGVRLVLTRHHARFLREHWFDVLLLAVPMLRPLRPLRAVMALNVLASRGGQLGRGRVVGTVAVAGALVGLVAALAMLDSERGRPGTNINDFGDALWWAVATLSTVGYGDRYPVTTEGRLVAIGLMVTGVALVGVITAALASWFVERMSEVQAGEERTAQELVVLTEEVRLLREQLAALAAGRESIPERT